MQANDMLRGYDDRDGFELAQARLAYKKHTTQQTYFIIKDNEGPNRINSSGKHRSMLAAYVHWWRTLRDAKRKQGPAFNITLTLFDGRGMILRSVTMKRG